MHRCLSATILCCTIMVLSAEAAPNDLLEKINRLEQQIQELKALKEQQLVSEEKMDQCMKAVGRDKFCKCIADGLPPDVTFEQYVHTLITPKNKLGYDTFTTIQKKAVDDTIEMREKCVEKGFFK